MRVLLYAAAVVALLAAAAGCSATHTQTVSPDASLLITGERWGSFTVAAFNHETGQLDEVGRVRAGDFVGWTLHKFDWNTVTDGGD